MDMDGIAVRSLQKCLLALSRASFTNIQLRFCLYNIWHEWPGLSLLRNHSCGQTIWTIWIRYELLKLSHWNFEYSFTTIERVNIHILLLLTLFSRNKGLPSTQLLSMMTTSMLNSTHFQLEPNQAWGLWSVHPFVRTLKSDKNILFIRQNCSFLHTLFILEQLISYKIGTCTIRYSQRYNQYSTVE